MSNKSAIEWTDATWNPIRGCSRVSEGCRHCYAERVASRFAGPGQPYEGLIKLGKWNGRVKVVNKHLADPLRWKMPRRIFVNSMSDLFHESLTNEEIAAVFGVMAAAPRHTFQVLTKRAKRMREWFEWAHDEASNDRSADDFNEGLAFLLAHHAANELGDGSDGSQQRQYDSLLTVMPMLSGGLPWPLPNVWLGVSVENQAAADERIPELLRTPAAVRFLSCEPLLGDVYLSQFMRPEKWGGRALHWVIAGCESGPGARPCDVGWMRSLRDQCASAGVSFFLKQATGPNPSRVGFDAIADGPGSHRKAGGIIGAPYLDGVQHLAFPAVDS